MNAKYLLLIIVVTLCGVGLYQLVNASRQTYPEFKFTAGQIAGYDIRAPFDFPILKTDEQLEEEYATELERVGKPHMLSADVEFEAYSNLDELFDLVNAASQSGDRREVFRRAGQQGFTLDNPGLVIPKNRRLISEYYSTIKNEMARLYQEGVYTALRGDSIAVNEDGEPRKRNLGEYYDLAEAREQTLLHLSSARFPKTLVELNADKLIMANLVLDSDKYEEVKKQVAASIDPVSGWVRHNELVISKDQRLTQADIDKINSLTREYQARGDRKSPLLQWLGFLGLLLFVASIISAFTLYYYHSPLHADHGYVGAAVLNGGLLLLIMMAILTHNVLGLSASLIPFALVMMSAAILLGYDFGVFYAACGALLLAPFLNWDASGISLLLLSFLVTLVLVRRYRSRHEFIKIWTFLFLALNLINAFLSLVLYTGDDLLQKAGDLLRTAGYSLVSTTLSVLGCLALVTYFERKWMRATKQVLLELQDFNHPLLKRLATNAVGTYHHSLVVGNLAERAAEAIGANSMLARVGSYFHDIGKSVNPEIFTENNEDSAEFYAKFTPEESADIIRDHVKEGVVLAEKHHLPKAVIDIIWQHHGTSYIRYFLDLAQRQGEVPDLEAFRYPGPLPQSREAALVMLADVVESTSKSKQTATEDDIAKLVEDTIQRLIREGQFDKAPITVRDLALAKAAMCPVLESVFRKRLEYPEERAT